MIFQDHCDWSDLGFSWKPKTSYKKCVYIVEPFFIHIFVKQIVKVILLNLKPNTQKIKKREDFFLNTYKSKLYFLFPGPSC